MTYLQTVMFIVQPNTLTKVAENKYSAEYSLRNSELKDDSTLKITYCELESQNWLYSH